VVWFSLVVYSLLSFIPTVFSCYTNKPMNTAPSIDKENRVNFSQTLRVLQGTGGATGYSVMYWKEEESGDWIVQKKPRVGSVQSIGRYKSFSDAMAIAAKHMSDIQTLFGGGMKKPLGLKYKNT
jgi:hypothetical protein